MGRPSSSSYHRANSFATNDMPNTSQSIQGSSSNLPQSQDHQHLSNGPPPPLPNHQMSSPSQSSHPVPPRKLTNEYYPTDIEMQNRAMSPQYQQQPMYYNNMYPPPQQQQQPVYLYPQEDIYKGHPLKRALLGPIRQPIFSHLSALAMLGVLIYELVRNYQLTSSVIQTQPMFNVMIGPSFSVLINIGAKFTPCMRALPNISTSNVYGQCFGPNDTCTLSQMCGLSSLTTIPNQAYRFVSPIFMHAGIVHFLLNMLTHLRLGVDLERSLGTPRYMLLYMASGIWGFVLSAMLANENTASMGCSGALFGLIGYMFIDVLINWRVIQHPWRELISLFISTIISLVLGLLPGLDNFAHLGGFVVGLVMGLLIAPTRPMATKNIIFLTWIGRIIALAIIIVMFVVGIKQFYESPDPSLICPNCRYLSCLPVNGWCDNYQTRS
ncbi:rhomboid family-domain-containing protein [Halteromyces radiatus]|uniref:rhomboid family-domain-containing protein n=1 Tax=Halteromyces radiatus TaxID=101107 RepID=UPI0022205F3C|nr:rhomboid family-domain-containing protein [Halteromyces radiatus]KAI8099606.1 rhomboid family-domain-containing protein [Halteromyces radiatus]